MVDWIADAVKNRGSLHKALKVPDGEIIPKHKIAKAAKSDDVALAKKARLAETLGHLHKRHGGCV